MLKIFARLVLACVLAAYGATFGWTAYNAPISCPAMPALTGNVTTSAGSCATTIGAAQVTDAMLAGSITPSKVTGTAAILGANTFTGIQTYGSGDIRPIRVITASGAVTVATTDYFVCINKTSGAATAANLPGTPTAGTVFVIKDCKGDAATNNITVTPAAGNIDGAGTYVMTINYQAVNVVYNGTQWNIY